MSNHHPSLPAQEKYKDTIAQLIDVTDTAVQQHMHDGSHIKPTSLAWAIAQRGNADTNIRASIAWVFNWFYLLRVLSFSWFLAASVGKVCVWSPCGADILARSFTFICFQNTGLDFLPVQTSRVRSSSDVLILFIAILSLCGIFTIRIMLIVLVIIYGVLDLKYSYCSTSPATVSRRGYLVLLLIWLRTRGFQREYTWLVRPPLHSYLT